MQDRNFESIDFSNFLEYVGESEIIIQNYINGESTKLTFNSPTVLIDGIEYIKLKNGNLYEVKSKRSNGDKKKKILEIDLIEIEDLNIDLKNLIFKIIKYE